MISPPEVEVVLSLPFVLNKVQGVEVRTPSLTFSRLPFLGLRVGS